MTLLLRPPLIADEGILGYRFRLAEANSLSVAALRDVGIQYDLGMLEDMGYLQPGFRLSQEGAKAQAIEAAWLTYPMAWNREWARYCPMCLSEKHYWRFEWEILYGDACAKHAVWLLDQCSNCGRLLSWGRPRLMYCECGEALKNQPALACPPPVRALASSLRGAVIQDNAPTGLCIIKSLKLGQIQRLIRLLGAYGDDAPCRLPQKVSGCARIHVSWQITSLASEILAGWPVTFFKILDRMQSRPSALNTGRLEGRFGHFYSLLFRAFPEPEFDFLRQALENYVVQHWRGAFGRRNRRLSPNILNKRAWIPARHARQILGASRQRLDELIYDGRVTAEERFSVTGRRFLMVKREDVETEQARQSTDLNLSSAARLLGLKKRRMAKLMPQLIPEARKTRSTGNAWAISRQRINELLSLLYTVPQLDDSSDEISVGEVLRFWPWSDEVVAYFLRDCISGRLKPVSRTRSGQGIVCLRFQREHLKVWFTSMQPLKHELLTIPEFAERLYIKQEVAYFLVRKGFVRVQQMSNGRNTMACISPESLSDFENHYVFCRDLAASFNTSSRWLAEKLSRLGIYPVCGPGVDNCRQLIYERNDSLTKVLVMVGRGNAIPHPFELLASPKFSS